MTQGSKTKAVVFSTLSLLANSALTMNAHATGEISSPEHFTPNASEKKSIPVNHLNTNQLEASFLKVSRMCKVDNASFEPVSVGIETISNQIVEIHSLVEYV